MPSSAASMNSDVYFEQHQKPTFSWRDDPHTTSSDWTIVVLISAFDSQTYHVHKRILSVGPRSSKYFAKLFKQTYVDHSNTTEIELDKQDADTFPLLLDFMYNTTEVTNENDVFHSANVVSLGHLARVFECEGLTESVHNFIQTDLTFKTGPIYVLQGYYYQDEDLIQLANTFCVENFSHIETRAIVRLPMPLFRSLIKAVVKKASKKSSSFNKAKSRGRNHLSKYTRAEEEDDDDEEEEDACNDEDIKRTMKKDKEEGDDEKDKNKDDDEDNDDDGYDDEEALSYQLSEVVCQYFVKNPDSLTLDLLLELTDERIMPRMASEPAIGFTALARELNPKIKSPDSSHWRRLVALCQRCAQAVVGEYGWTDFNVDTALEEYVQGPCCCNGISKMDSLLFATSFAAALTQAQIDYNEMIRSISATNNANTATTNSNSLTYSNTTTNTNNDTNTNTNTSTSNANADTNNETNTNGNTNNANINDHTPAATADDSRDDIARRDNIASRDDIETKKELYSLQRQNVELEMTNRRQRDDVERYKRVLAETKEELLALGQQVKILRLRQEQMQKVDQEDEQQEVREE